MVEKHIVEAGECLCSIAKRYGFRDYRAIYDHPMNIQLKKKRSNPNLLFPGDTVYIPDMQNKQEGRGTSQMHRFQIDIPQITLHIVLQNDQGEAFANKYYLLKVEDQVKKGYTGNKGQVEQLISADAKNGELRVYLSENDQEGVHFPLAIGSLAPVEEMKGVQARLNNLGYDCGRVDGILGARTTKAIRSFQKHNPPLAVDGICGPKTRAQLLEKHGS